MTTTPQPTPYAAEIERIELAEGNKRLNSIDREVLLHFRDFRIGYLRAKADDAEVVAGLVTALEIAWGNQHLHHYGVVTSGPGDRKEDCLLVVCCIAHAAVAKAKVGLA